MTSLNDGTIATTQPTSASETSYSYPDQAWRVGVVGMTGGRPDPVGRVLTFTSAPLAEDLEIAGPIKLVLYAASTQKDTDFIVKLSEQMPQSSEDRGRGIQPASRNVSKGWLRASYRELKRFPAEVNRGIPKGQVGSESMGIDSPLGGEPCAARIPVKCEYESLDLLKREHRGGKPPSSWRSAQVPQLDGCSTGKQSAFLGQNHAEEAFLRWSGMRSGYSLSSLSSRI